MNRCCYNRMGYRYGVHGPAVYGMGNIGVNNIFEYNNGFNFQSLIILILILLQFGKRDTSGNIVDNSILFIIVFFFLVCGCGRGFGARCGVGY